MIKTAEKFYKSFTAYAAYALIVLPQVLDFLVEIEPVIGDKGAAIISVIGAVILVLRAIPQPELHSDD